MPKRQLTYSWTLRRDPDINEAYAASATQEIVREPKIGETTGEALPSPLSEHSPKAANRPPSLGNNKDKALFGFIAMRFLISLGKGFSVCQLLCISLADISCRGWSLFHWRSYLSGERLTHDRQTRLEHVQSRAKRGDRALCRSRRGAATADAERCARGRLLELAWTPVGGEGAGEKYSYQFKAVNDKTINAFALPGGYRSPSDIDCHPDFTHPSPLMC